MDNAATVTGPTATLGSSMLAGAEAAVLGSAGTTATGAAASAATSLATTAANAVGSSLANYVLIGVGIILAIGALLISQKQPIQNITSAALGAVKAGATVA